MKCSNPDCNRSIGLVSHRRGWFSKRRYCSRNCLDVIPTDVPKQSQQESHAMSYVEWLFLQPIERPHLKLMPARVRTEGR
jgi:hypothetical protein